MTDESTLAELERLIAASRRGELVGQELQVKLSQVGDSLVADSRALAARQWQLISTAPRDRKAYLVWCPGNLCTFCVTWDEEAPPRWRYFGGGGILWQIPTHWQPLPEPPTIAAPAAQKPDGQEGGGT